MSLDGGWALIISGILVIFLSGVSVLVWRHVDNAQEEAEEGKAAAAKVADALHLEQIERLKFQTHVAETYARVSGVERMETNINSILSRMEVKIDAMKDQRVAQHG